MPEAWDTYVPAGKTIRRAALGGNTAAAAPLATVKAEQKNIKSLQDATWNAVAQASGKLIKRSGPVSPAVAAAVDVSTAAAAKGAPRAPAKQKRSAPPTATATPVPAIQQPQAREAAPLPMVMGNLPVHTLEQHARRDDQQELFAQSVERAHRAPTSVIAETPANSTVLQYCAQWKRDFLWVDHVTEEVAANPEITFQRTPVIRRSVLLTFMREPDPQCPWERPCFNLDRPPLAHEQGVQCISHLLSEKELGTGRGYRCRELLFNGQSIRINAALDHNARIARGEIVGNPVEPVMDPIPEMCYMCHVWMTTNACLDQKNRIDDRSRRDMTNTDDAQPIKRMVTIVNRFMVDIDKPGEYDRRAMLPILGVWGPFPQWTPRNYKTVRITNLGLRGFDEHPRLDFRLSLELSQRTERAPKSSSTRSTPMSVVSAGTTSHP